VQGEEKSHGAGGGAAPVGVAVAVVEVPCVVLLPGAISTEEPQAARGTRAARTKAARFTQAA
jgi:hypothetical protein